MEAHAKDKIPPASAAIAQAKPINAVEELARALEQMSKTANVLSPVAAVDSIMALHQVSLRVVKVDGTVDSNGNGPECYFDKRFCKPGEVALGKNALAKIMGAAGVQIASKRRLDDRSDPNYCEVEVVLAIRDFDGTLRQVIASKEMDLRPGAPETMKPEYVNSQKTGRMVAQEDTAIADKRRHIQSHAETKAIERGIRLLFSLRQKYTAAELQKPFVVPKLVPALDPSDPEQKAALIQHALGGQAALYGGPRTVEPARMLKAAGDDYEEETVDLGAMPEAPKDAPPAPPELPPEEPAEPPCGLPISDTVLQACDAKRLEYVKVIAWWCNKATDVMPPEATDALFRKLGTGFDPLAAPAAEMRGLVGALKAEIQRVSG
jgi:hypothetical protein